VNPATTPPFCAWHVRPAFCRFLISNTTLNPTSFACQTSILSFPQFKHYALSYILCMSVRPAFCRFLISITSLYPTPFACQNSILSFPLFNHYALSYILCMSVRPAFYRFLNSITTLYPTSFACQTSILSFPQFNHFFVSSFQSLRFYPTSFVHSSPGRPQSHCCHWWDWQFRHLHKWSLFPHFYILHSSIHRWTLPTPPQSGTGKPRSVVPPWSLELQVDFL
jgi:hypothetical protein